MRLLLALPLLAFPLAAQSLQLSLIRQPKATALEFTVPVAEIQVRNRRDVSAIHLGVGLGGRHWDDGDNAMRFLMDASASFNDLFAGLTVVTEVPPGEGVFVGPRLRVGWTFHPSWALSLEGEHLERPFSPGLHVRRRSSLGLVLTARF